MAKELINFKFKVMKIDQNIKQHINFSNIILELQFQKLII